MHCLTPVGVDSQVILPEEPDVGPTQHPQALQALFEECREKWREHVPVDMPSDPRLRSAFIDFMPWIAEPAVAQLHQHLVTLAAPPGEASVRDQDTVLLENLLEAAVIVHLDGLNKRIKEASHYTRQVCTPSQCPASFISV